MRVIDTQGRLKQINNASTLTLNTTAPLTGGGTLAPNGSLTIAASPFVAAGASHAAGTVPDPGASAHTIPYYLGDDAAFHAMKGSGCRLWNSANQSIASSTPTALTFDTNDTDTDAYHSVSLNTSRITIPTGFDGLFMIGGEIEWNPGATSGFFQLTIRKNGVTTVAGNTLSSTAFGAVATDQDVTTVLSLVGGDYVELIANQSITGAGPLNSSTATSPRAPNFWIARLR